MVDLKIWDSSIKDECLTSGGSSDINSGVHNGLVLLKMGNNAYKDSSLRTYGRSLNRLYCEAHKAGLDMELENGVIKGIRDTKAIIDIIEGGIGAKLTDRTMKSYYTLLLALLRTLETHTAEYKIYRSNFDMIKKSLDNKQIKQEPKPSEKFLENLNMKVLDSSLNIYYKKIMASKKTDLQSSSYYMLGLLHIDQVLRNEAIDLLLTDTYLDMKEHPKTNFIYNAGRNSKRMIIRCNKVRNPDHEGYKGEKEVKLGKKLNSAINRHIETLRNNDLYTDGKPIPLVLKRLDKGGELDLEWKCSSSVYAYIMKRIWKHKGWELTSTLIRKLYAIEVRMKYKGNLLKEREACEKLDHSQDTHDKHYVLYFD